MRKSNLSTSGYTLAGESQVREQFTVMKLPLAFKIYLENLRS